MNFESKYGIGDVVFRGYVGDSSKKIPCPECDGTGRLRIEGKSMTVNCPECNGHGGTSVYDCAPCTQKLTIGQVGVIVTDSYGLIEPGQFHNYSPQKAREERYMCVETGIGSGNVYSEHDLWTTEELAFDAAKWKCVEWRERREAEAAEREKQRQLNAERLAAEDA